MKIKPCVLSNEEMVINMVLKSEKMAIQLTMMDETLIDKLRLCPSALEVVTHLLIIVQNVQTDIPQILGRPLETLCEVMA